jgi:endonuclease IV
MIIGLSTGCFFPWKPDVRSQMEEVLSMNIDALQILCASIGELDEFIKSGLQPMKMKNVYFHLPWKGIRYGCNKETESVIKKMRELKQKAGINSFVIEADSIENIDPLKGFNILVENLNVLGKFGATAEDITKIKKSYNTGFVFDIAHLYAAYGNFDKFGEMIDAMGSSLKMVHISGFSKGKWHSTIFDAENKKQLSECLKKLKHYPIIIESIMGSRETAEKELEFVRSMLAGS